ncbi:Ger(x)C family spore germination protein [Paenibacillus sp. p3-SID867]|uniref:Ger(x)C family spore germination protein n=1 Tax=Paenibacillus sp. p3-SID867 TaxID=2916363 RepID=UPI0021A54654|nr:Ger(x)C family spore germination protein [Paenibacillus sp. p3-SID867]MCT1400618.1 Ger(x)C family spore germination protein [Paenibacillus sp. p3-SID867]
MKRILALILLHIVITLFLSGCWNRRELNDLAIAVAAGVDWVDGRYRLTVQVANPGQLTAKRSGGPQAPATLFTAEGDTIFEAARRMTQNSPRKIYFSHLRMFLMDEAMAKEGIAKVLDLLSRDHEFRPDFYLVVTKGATAEETLKIMTPMETIPANKLYESLQISEKVWSPSMAVTLDELISDLTSSGKHPVLTGLIIAGNRDIGKTKKNVENINTPSQLKYSGLAVFKRDKQIGWLNEKDSRGYRLITGHVKSSVDFIPCRRNDGKVIVETLRSETKLKGRMVQSRPEMDIRINMEGNIGSVECGGLDLSQPDTVRDLEVQMEERLTQSLEAVIAKVQTEHKVDIFGFGEAFRRAHPKAWKGMKDEWEDRYFPSLETHIQVNYKIRRTGTTNDSFLNDIKE